MANTQHLLSGFLLLQQRTDSIAMTTTMIIKMATDPVPAMAAYEMALPPLPPSPAACGKGVCL